jgi:hypothetical protein
MEDVQVDAQPESPAVAAATGTHRAALVDPHFVTDAW